MSEGFVHSVKVPRLYKITAHIVENVQEKQANVKSLIFGKKHPNVSGIYALTLNTLNNGSLLNDLIRKTGILMKEPRLDPWLARVLITELLWGKKCLKSDCKPVKTVLSYEQALREELSKSKKAFTKPDKPAVRKPRYIRVNTLLSSVEDAVLYFQNEGWYLLPKSQDYSSYLNSLSNLSKYNFIQDFHINELFAFPPDTPFHDCTLYMDGKIILQDKASCIPPYLLNPTPGSIVLDMCAAPGMKTTHLAGIMQNQGKIYAVEIDTKRYKTLCEQIKDKHVYCAETLNMDTISLTESQCPGVEYILVDPSCTGSGMIDRPNISSIDDNIDMNRLRNLHGFQVMILLSALLKFPNAKRIVYSTCSLHREENEDVIDEVKTAVGDAYNLVPIKKIFRNNWINYSSMDSGCKDNCLYARPEVDYSNGFFVAMFERNFDVPLPRQWCDNREFIQNNTESEKLNCTAETKQLSSTHYQQVENEEKKGKKKKRGKKKKQVDEEAETLEPPPKKKASNPTEETNTELNTTETTPRNKTHEVINNEETENLFKKTKSKKDKTKTSFNDTITESCSINETINDPQETLDADSTTEKKHKKKKKKSK